MYRCGVEIWYVVEEDGGRSDHDGLRTRSALPLCPEDIFENLAGATVISSIDIITWKPFKLFFSALPSDT